MKPPHSPISSNSNVIKQFLYALQVIIIALAIPVLYYVELSHKEHKAQHTKDAYSESTIA